MPTATTVACPSCKASLKLGASLAGKKIRCSKCKNVFAPGAAAKKTSPAPAAPAGNKIACPGCKLVLKVPANFPAGKKIKCPKCTKAFAPGQKAETAAPPRAAAKAAPKPAVAPKPATNGPPAKPVAKAPPKPVAKAPAKPVKAPPKPPPEPEPSFDDIDDLPDVSDVAASPEPSEPPPRPAPTPPRPAPAKKPELDEDEEEARKRNKKLLMGLGGLLLLSPLIYYFFLAGPAGPTLRTVYPAEGVVLYKGKPAEGARVTFVPVEASKDTYRPSGITDVEGVFKLTTYHTNDGAPAGKYKVAIIWVPPPKAAPPVKAGQVKDAFAEPVIEKDRLQDKYSDANASGLEREVKNESLNKLEPFDLK
jgi:hypothetical protein